MLTPLELDVMKAIWLHPPSTVREVHAALRPSRNLAYTTVMTVMDRLYHKGFLARSLKSRSHLYEPAISYEEVRDDAVENLVKTFFDGSRGKLRDFLSGSRGGSFAESVSPAALDEALL